MMVKRLKPQTLTKMLAGAIIIVALVGGAYLLAYASATHGVSVKNESITRIGNCRWAHLVEFIQDADARDTKGMQSALQGLQDCANL